MLVIILIALQNLRLITYNIGIYVFMCIIYICIYIIVVISTLKHIINDQARSLKFHCNRNLILENTHCGLKLLDMAI